MSFETRASREAYADWHSNGNENKGGSKNDKLVLAAKPEDAEKRYKEEMRQHEMSIETAARWLSSTLENQKSYKEKIPLNRNRSFDVPKDITEMPPSVSMLVKYAQRMDLTQKGLYDLAQEISQKHQDIHFTFKVDPAGKWIEYEAFKQNLKAGDTVMWETHDAVKWSEPLVITKIQEDSNTKRKFASFAGLTSFAPLDELRLIKN